MFRFFYGTAVGRFLLRIPRSRWVSKLVGKFLDSRISKPLISKFVKKNQIDLGQLVSSDFHCFNDCFSRKIKPEYRPLEPDLSALIAPCDGLLSAYRITGDTVLPVKQSQYTIPSLLRDEELAKKYENGICLVFRLCVNHYHRYCYLDNGTKGENVFIPGTLHTVRPVALAKYPVFVENCREYTVMETEHFGTVTQVEVGAMLVGKIRNFQGSGSFCRGEEKGTFEYGGSTVILLLEPNRVTLPEILFEKTRQGEEFPVLMGKKLGSAEFVNHLEENENEYCMS